MFGYDFLIDEDLRTWLIEVNTNPYFGTPNDFIKGLLPKMIDDMLDLKIDGIFKPTKYTSESPNDFELIYCEQYSNHSPVPINVRSLFTSSVYPL